MKFIEGQEVKVLKEESVREHRLIAKGAHGVIICIDEYDQSYLVAPLSKEHADMFKFKAPWWVTEEDLEVLG